MLSTLLLLFALGAPPQAPPVREPAKAPPVRAEAAVAVHAGYPVRAAWWTHPDEIHAHLMSGEHRGKWPSDWVRGLSNAEAESLHSDDHEGRVKWQYVPRAAQPKPKISYEFCPTGH